ncbi:MAG: hypothetical protein EBS05_11295 [Proteobacteria bacterium]|nr:hypothetical protein [Pseudomonadota bacterium]
MKQYLAESIGTFAIVFAGTGAIVINEASGGVISHVGIALIFGLIVLAMIYTVGEIYGAHLNPAVTLGFWAARKGREDSGASSSPAGGCGRGFPKCGRGLISRSPQLNILRHHADETAL